MSAEGQEPIVAVEQRTMEFYGDQLLAVKDEAGTVWVPIKPISDSLGLSWSGQSERIRRDPVLSEEMHLIRVTRIESISSRGNPEFLCLPLDYLNGWLFGVNAARVKADLREKVIQYQRECYRVLARAFQPAQPAPLDDALIAAMEENARQQLTLWQTIAAERRRLRATEEFVEYLDQRVNDHDKLFSTYHQALEELRRLQEDQNRTLTRHESAIRLLPVPSDVITPAQQATITGLVNDLVATAQHTGQRLGQGKSDHAAVWATLKRRFNVAKYQDLTQAQYGQVIAWLEAWLDRVRQSD